MISKKEISKLKKRLPRGYFKQLVARVSFSDRTVSNFFEGKIYHLEIHQAVLDQIDEYEKQKTELLNRQNSVADAKQ